MIPQMSDQAIARELPLCACGSCTERVKTPSSKYAWGHHMRIATKKPGGGVEPVREPAGLCQCLEKCGQTVSRPGRRFVDGHQNATYRKGVEMACGGCGNRRHVKESRAATWQACSRSCLAIMAWQARAWNPLQRRCVQWMRTTRGSRDTLAAAAGVPEHLLSDWFYGSERRTTLPAATLARLAELLGITHEKAVELAGGLTVEERKAQRARQQLADYREQLGDDGFIAHQQTTARHKRGKRSATAIANVMAGRKRTGAHEASIARLKDARADPLYNKLLARLSGRLRRFKSTSNPSAQEKNSWAGTVCQELTAEFPRLTRALVLAYWKPTFERRSLRADNARRGGHVLKERLQFIEEQMATWPRTGGGKLKKGFLAQIAPELFRREYNVELLTPDDLERFSQTVKRWMMRNLPLR